MSALLIRLQNASHYLWSIVLWIVLAIVGA